MKNSEISEIFRDIAAILQIKGDNSFRIRAYEKAAQNIEGLTEDIESFVKGKKLTEIPGIGKYLADKITELITTGRIKAYEDLKKTIPEGVLGLLDIPGIGPRTARLLYEKLRIRDIYELEAAIGKNRLEGIFGIKEKTIKNILKGIELLKRKKERMPLAVALQVADEFISALKKMPEVKKMSVAGSLRRQKETVRDIDILVVSDKPQRVMEAFVKLAVVKDVIAKGETKSSVRIRDDVQVDCRAVQGKSFGAALLYFTGSKNFNIHLRTIAQRQGLKISEYGIFRQNRYLAGRTEEEVFKLLKMSYIEPELREDSGEIELAQRFKLPQLLELKDIKGDLHVHSQWSDGRDSIEKIIQACLKRGYAYAAITDHSQSLKVARGMTVADLKKKKAEIDKINKKLKGFRVLYAAEVDIDSSGNLDYSNEILKGFDIVVAAIHTGFKQSKTQLTKRLLKACASKYVHILAHPTGRLWGVRDAYELDYDALLKAAKENNTQLEINAFPSRLDLHDLNCRRAKEMGVRLALGTDAHAVEHLGAMNLGVSVARRGWLTKEDVINEFCVERLLKSIKK